MRSFTFISLAASALCAVAAPLLNADVDAKVGAKIDARGGLIDVENNQIDPTTGINVLSSRDLVEAEGNQVDPTTDVHVLSARNSTQGLKSVPVILDALFTDLENVVDELSKCS